MNRLIDYLFWDKATGEEFFVETPDGMNKAIEEANKYFDDPKLIAFYEPEDAEILGYDTY